MVVPTAPAKSFHPWQVEWDRGREIRCILGIIADANITAQTEWLPKNFPKGMSQSLVINSTGISQRTFKKELAQFSNKPYQTGIKSGSSKVYYKVTYGRITGTDFTDSPAKALLADAAKGYVFWKESVIINKTDSVYVILHVVNGNWCLSVVDESDLTSSDIKIAVFKKQQNRHISDWEMLQLWKSDVQSAQIKKRHFFEIQVTERPSNTFRIKFAYDACIDWNVWGANGSTYQWSPNDGVAGVLRRFIPTVDGQPLKQSISESPHFDITQTTYFYLEVTRNAEWVASELVSNNDSCSTPNHNGYTTDYLSDVKIIKTTADIGDPYSITNSTPTTFKVPLGFVKITDSKLEFYEMYTQIKDGDSSQMTIGYGGAYRYDEWNFDGTDQETGCYNWYLVSSGGIEPPYSWSVWQKIFPVDVSYAQPIYQP